MNRFRTSSLHALPAALVAAFSILLLPACLEETTAPPKGPAQPAGALVATTECKTAAPGLGPAYPANRDCIVWEHDGNGTLNITHVNAGLNCCPGTIRAEIEIADNEIVIAAGEGDDSDPCRCLCLYDLAYELTGIAAGRWTIVIVEQYLPEGAEILALTVDLSLEPSGSHCVVRETYPWGLGYAGTEPVGSVEARLVCKDFPADFQDVDPALPSCTDPSSACVLLHYDADRHRLSLKHSNAGFNCCVDTLAADFVFGPGMIEITEREQPPGGYCDCACLYDVGFTILHLEPGRYTIRIVEPYLPPGNDTLEFTIDLTATRRYVHCVRRSGYPWGAGSDEKQDRMILRRMYEAIVACIGTPYCREGADCRSVAVGAKPCGGPWEYLIYSAATLDEETLFEFVARHEEFERYMNERYGYVSTCDIPPVPVTECFEEICRAARP